MFNDFAGILCFFLGLALVLALVAVVGHGLWVLAAAIFSSRKRAEFVNDVPARRRPRLVVCAGCSASFSRFEERCPECDLAFNPAHADELNDLEAAARTIQRLKEQGTLSDTLSEQVFRGIEARRGAMLERKPRVEAGPIERLEAWFDRDHGAALSVDEKRQVLAVARDLAVNDQRNLSPRALVGIARLQTSVGLVNRACRMYQVLLECHPHASNRATAAREALAIASKFDELRHADELIRIIENVPGLIDEQPEFARLIAEIRGQTPVAAPVEVPPSVIPVVTLARRVEAPAVVQPVESAPIEVAPIEIIPEVIPEPVAPRRSFAEWIAVFMEERNILWGELIGGTLIIGCSIALVISLWDKLASIEYFPFLIFSAITSAILSAGFYTLHHWKLESTSRGLLFIGSLLVPLNYAVLTGLNINNDADAIHYVLGVSALALFGWLLARAVRILIQTPLETPAPSAILVSLSMLVSAGALLIAPACLANDVWRSEAEYALSMVPVVALVFAVGWILLQLHRVEPWNVRRLSALAIALGIAMFACGVTLGFLLFSTNELATTMQHLSPALTFFGVPLLLAGTMMERKLAAVPSEAGETIGGAENRGLWRTLGTGLALAGLFVMFGGFAVSIEQPSLRWLCGLINVGTLLAVAWSLRAPTLHIPMQLYLGILFVTGWSFDIDTLIRSPDAALRLTALMVLQAIIAEAWMRLGRARDAYAFAAGSVVSTALAIILILTQAPGHAEQCAIVLGAAALTWLAANLRWRLSPITYASSLVLAGAIFFTFRAFDDGPLPQQLLRSLLIHATLCLLAGLALRFTSLDWPRDVYRTPLQYASLLATFLVVALVVVERTNGNLSWTECSIACVWLAALWLILAVLEISPVLFGAFQVALCLAWFFGIGAHLTALEWDWREPYSLHVYAVGFAALCLAWELSRIFARSNPRALALLAPPFVPIDRIFAGGLVLGQFALAAQMVFWNAGRELMETPDLWRILPLAWYDHAYSIWPWVLAVLLTGVMIVWLRRVDLGVALFGLTLLALTVPMFVAGGWFDETRSAASALRWGLVIVYGVGSALLWNRHRLTSETVPAIALRSIFVFGAVLPTLYLTTIVVARKLMHLRMAGPDGGIFEAMTGPVSLLIPLALLTVILAGHGFRERLAYYLTSAGLVANAGSVGAFFLSLPRGEFGPSTLANALLIAAGVAWAWLILWVWLGHWLEEGQTTSVLDPLLLAMQNLLGIVLFAAVLLPALVWVVFQFPDGGNLWTQTAGSLGGWAVYGLMASGTCYLFWVRRAKLSLDILGVLSCVAVGVVACSAEFVFNDHDHSFIALMFLSGLLSCAWACVTLCLDPGNPPAWLHYNDEHGESLLYTVLPGALAVLLGAATLFTPGFHIAAAQSIVLTASACALLAYQRRSELWPTLATLLLMLAGTIVVVHFKPDELWLWLVQVNLAIVGVASLARLWLHRFLAPNDIDRGQLHFLPTQIAAGMLGNFLLIGAAFLAFLVSPKDPEVPFQRIGQVAGWAALLGNVAAAVWYFGVISPWRVIHAIALGGLMLGVVLAGTVETVGHVSWMAHHVLTLSWILLALGLMIVAWMRRANEVDIGQRWFPERSAQAWVTICGAFVVALALRATIAEPESPVWSVGATVCVILLLGALAIWARTPIYLYGAGLLFNVIGLLIYFAWAAQQQNLADDAIISVGVLAQILSFGVAVVACSLLERMLLRFGVDLARPSAIPYAQAGLLFGVFTLAIFVGVANVSQLNGNSIPIDASLAWLSLGVLAGAALVEIWRPGYHRATRYQLYVCGLMAMGLFLHQMSLANSPWFLVATLLLAGYLLLIVVLMRLTLAIPVLAEFLHLREKPDTGSRWFWHAQLGVTALVVALSIWISLTYDSNLERLGGVLACALVTTAAFLLVGVWPRVYASEDAEPGLMLRLFSYYLVLTLGLVFALEMSWAFLDPTLRFVWMQRSAAAFSALVTAFFVCRFAIPRWASESAWVEPSRWMHTLLGPLSLVVLLALLGQELVHYEVREGFKRTPLLYPLTAPSGVAVLALAWLALQSALSKRPDPYGVEGENRSFYVYLTELLALAFVVHLRLIVPKFLPGFLGQYWYLSVMVLAFVGVAFSEIFTRRNQPILAVPLRRTAILLAFIPVLAFQLAPIASVLDRLHESIPGLEPFLDYLKHMSTMYEMHAVCWLLLGIFFAWQSHLRHSANLGIFAALAVNFGVWVLLGHHGTTEFAQRPQLWLIPLGLIVLVAEYVNRGRLGFWPSLSVRYVGLLCIYLSSTIEMFMAGLGASQILPIVLALLSVVGVLLGILFRVRAFVLAGFLALLVVTFAQIWHAAVQPGQTWIWWVCGIILGVLILLMFALFEKHRNEVAKLLDNMKRWN